MFLKLLTPKCERDMWESTGADVYLLGIMVKFGIIILEWFAIARIITIESKIDETYYLCNYGYVRQNPHRHNQMIVKATKTTPININKV